MLLTDALPYLQTLIRTGGTHQDYAHCIKVRDFYYALATGEGLGKYLRRFESRESEQQFKERLNLVTFRSPAVWSALRKPFQGVARIRFGVNRRFDYPNQSDQDRRAAALNEIVGRYYDDNSLDYYLSEELDDLVLDTDPNAWLLTEFQEFDYRSEQADPYPVVIPCDNAIDFTTSRGGKHTSLTVRTAVTGGIRYTMYLADETIDAWPRILVEGREVRTMPEGVEPFVVFTDFSNRVTHDVQVLQHNTGKLPAKRVGFVPDKRTNGRTRISYLHSAAFYLDKALKLESESDIASAQVVHPHKAQYAIACPGDVGDICTDNGRNREGEICSVCKGTHINPTQTGAGDVLQLPYPAGAEARDIVDLSKLVVWNRPPTDILIYQSDLIDKYEVKAHLATFNSDILIKGDIAQTAAEYLSRKREFNKALEPYAANFSALFRYTVEIIAAYTDLAEGLEVVYELPEGLLPLTKEQLFSLRELAVKAGATPGELEEIDLDIARQRYKNDPEAFLRFRLRQHLRPFAGLSNEDVFKMRATGDCSTEFFILFFYLDSIIQDITDKQGSTNWYNLPYRLQKPIIDGQVQAIAQSLPSASPQTSLFSGFTPTRTTLTTATA
jgi:hypothetical protein